MKIVIILLACLALTAISCAPKKTEVKKSKSRQTAGVRPAHRWGLIDSAKNTQQRSVERQNAIPQGLLGKQE